MAPQAPILDLGTILHRPTIRIDGKLYDMRTSDEFTLLIYRKYQRKFQRLGPLMKKKNPSERDEREQARLLDEFVRQVVLAPDAVHDKLRDTHRLEILRAFFSQRPKTVQRTRRAAAPRGTTKATSTSLRV